MAVIKKTNPGKDMGKEDGFLSDAVMQLSRATMEISMEVSKKLKIELSCNLDMPLMSLKILEPADYSYIHIYCYNIHNNQNMEQP